MKISTAIVSLLALSFAPAAFAQDGTPNIPTNSNAGSNYSCDPNTCKLPSCLCASQSPPSGLSPKDVPQVSNCDRQLGVYRNQLGYKQKNI